MSAFKRNTTTQSNFEFDRFLIDSIWAENIDCVYVYFYLFKNTLIEELLQFFITIVDTKLFKTVHLEIFWKGTTRTMKTL